MLSECLRKQNCPSRSKQQTCIRIAEQLCVSQTSYQVLHVAPALLRVTGSRQR